MNSERLVRDGIAPRFKILERIGHGAFGEVWFVFIKELKTIGFEGVQGARFVDG